MNRFLRKRLTALLLAVVFALSAVAVPMTVHANDISVVVDGVPVVFEGTGPVTVGGRTLVPVRGVFETLGFTVDWEAETSTAVISNANYVIRLQIGSYTFTTNGITHSLDVPAQLIGAFTMVPIGAPLRTVGFLLGWDGDTDTVLIMSPVVALTATPTPTPTPTPEPEIVVEFVFEASVGDIIPFGNYFWRVLEIRSDRVLLVTEDIVRRRPFHNRAEPVTWADSALRAYLNSTFLTDAFTPEERQQIQRTTVVTDNNPWFPHVDGGSNTNDYVFLLSVEEVVRFFGDSGMLARGRPDTNDVFISDGFNRERIAQYQGRDVWWWTRSPGLGGLRVAHIEGGSPALEGQVRLDGNFAFGSLGGVRPAMWLRLTP